MAGVAMAASSDHMHGDHHRSQFQYSLAVTDSSWPSMPATGVPLHEKARHCPAFQPMPARKNIMVDYYNDETGSSNSGSAAMGPGQAELADVLKCILDEQQVCKPSNYYVTGLSDNCIDSAIAATLASDTKGFSTIGINVIDSSDRHGMHALDAGALPHATEYDVASSGSFADTLSVIDTHLKVHAQEANATIKCPHDCSTMACSSNSCSMCHCFPSNSASTSNILQGYDDHHPQQLESIDVDASCAAILTASSAHDSFDDYSLCTINGGTALSCSEFSQSKMGASPPSEANAAVAMDALQHVLHDQCQNVCIQQDQHIHVSEQSVDETAVGDMTECMLYTDNIAGSGPQQECNMVPVCHEETVYPLSGSQMKLMQREATYAAAAVQPVDWASILNVGAGARPKRRNVRISHDPQTVSARRRRERISDRIRVLQRMVPGGMKLDTASMLDEAIHYLKYLKSQVQALEWLEKMSSSSSAVDNVSNSSSFSPYSGWYSSFIQSSANTPLMQMIK